jgi:AcrR family transcriptional regulator
VLEAAAVVFESRGFASTSISDVLHSAQVTKGALYFHFESKEALARGVMEEQKRSLVLTNTGSHTQTVIDITQGVARLLRRDPVLRASIRLTVEQGAMGSNDPSVHQWWLEVCRTHLYQAERAGELNADAGPDDLAHLVVGSLFGVQLLSQVLTRRVDLVARVTTWWSTLLPGMVSERVLPRLDPRGSADLLARLNGIRRGEEASVR